MKKKTIKSITALAMSFAMVLSLGACANESSETEDFSDTDESIDEGITCIDASIGDMLYSDNKCSVTIKSIDTNDKGGSSITLSLVSNYDTSVGVALYPYDTDKFETFMESGSGVISLAEDTTSWIFLEEDNTEDEATWDFSNEYVYFLVEVVKYDRMATEDDVDEYLEGETLYSQYIKLTSEE